MLKIWDVTGFCCILSSFTNWKRKPAHTALLPLDSTPVEEKDFRGEISPAALLVDSNHPRLPRAEVVRIFSNKFRPQILDKVRYLKERERKYRDDDRAQHYEAQAHNWVLGRLWILIGTSGPKRSLIIIYHGSVRLLHLWVFASTSNSSRSARSVTGWFQSSHWKLIITPRS